MSSNSITVLVMHAARSLSARMYGVVCELDRSPEGGGVTFNLKALYHVTEMAHRSIVCDSAAFMHEYVVT